MNVILYLILLSECHWRDEPHLFVSENTETRLLPYILLVKFTVNRFVPIVKIECTFVLLFQDWNHSHYIQLLVFESAIELVSYYTWLIIDNCNVLTQTLLSQILLLSV